MMCIEGKMMVEWLLWRNRQFISDTTQWLTRSLDCD